MQKTLVWIFFLGIIGLRTQGQIAAPNATSTQMTNYTNGTAPDPIYIFCTPNYFGTPVSASLTAVPPGGTPGWTFEWFVYNQGTNSWNVHSTQTNIPTSTISGLASGGYRCVIKDGSGTVLGCYRAWVWLKQTTLHINNIAAGCEPFSITGNHSTNGTFTYYNPPADPFIINSSTVISVSFSATHTFVSDLGFYLVAPGGGTVLLSPNPGANGQGSICNSGDNVSNLTFTNVPSANFNPCTAVAPYSGTYSSYGLGNTPINWTSLYGSDATQGGWAVQIYDCISLDVGALTRATITFSGNASCGPSTITYNSGNINSAINDNSCSPQSASIFIVPPPPPTVAQTLTSTTTFYWTSTSGYSSNSGSIFPQVINPAPEQDTWFYLTVNSSVGCSNRDSVFFDYTPVDTPIIATPPVFCFNGRGDTLSVDIENGTWRGIGITDSITGFFDPVVAGPGLHQVIYWGEQPCGKSDTVMVRVSEEITFTPQITHSSCFDADDASISISILTGYMPVTGTWDTSPVQSGLIAFGLSPRTHRLILQDGYGCRDTSQHITTEPALLKLQASKIDVSCIGGNNGQTSAVSTGGTVPYMYSWNSTAPQSNPTITGLPIGTYSVTVTDYHGCTEDTTVTLVTLSTQPTVTSDIKNESCPDVFDAAIDITVANGKPPYTYLWNNSKTTEDIDSITAGIYDVTITDTYLCPYNFNFSVVAGKALDFAYSVTNVLCFSNNTGLISVTPMGGNPPYTYYVNGNNSGNTGNISNLFAGNYNVLIVDSKGCDSSFTTIVSEAPPMYVDSTHIQISLGNDIILQPTYSGGTGNLSLNWYPFYNLSCIDCPNPIAWPDKSTKYSLSVTDANGCVEIAQVIVDVLHDGPFIPNAFTPGKDELNNKWLVSDYGVKVFEVIIFDRWGNKVFYSDNIYDGWDGKLNNGNYYEGGMYAYKVYIRYIDGKEKMLLGDLILLR